jgi:hypothetical protein
VPPDRDPVTQTLPLTVAARAGRWQARWPLLLVPVWAALAAVNILLFGVGSPASHGGATRTAARPHITATAASPAVSAASSTPAPSVEPTLAAQVLVPVGAAAYGPTGLGSGDNPTEAVDAIDGDAAARWQTDWYGSAAFGGLQPGTGLLIDMGQPATITSVQMILGPAPGADLEILTGNASVRSLMHVQASVTDAATSIRLTLAQPESARYLLIWFTSLPPDAARTFQVSVSDVRIEGTP